MLIVLRLGGGQDCVRGVVANHAHHAAVPFGISKELAGFFERKACALVAASASRKVDPWSSSRVPDVGHGAVAAVAVHSASGVNVSLALRSDARMARIALILGSEFELSHATGMCSVHGMRESWDTGDAGCAERWIGVTFGAEHWLLSSQIGAMKLIVSG